MVVVTTAALHALMHDVFVAHNVDMRSKISMTPTPRYMPILFDIPCTYRIPRYLSGHCQLISDVSRRLRSSDTFTFAVPRTRTRLGDRSFCCCRTTDMEQSAGRSAPIVLKGTCLAEAAALNDSLVFGRRVLIHGQILIRLSSTPMEHNK